MTYYAAGADCGSVRRGTFVEEDANGHEGEGGIVGVGSQSRTREDKRVGGSGHPRDGGCCCGGAVSGVAGT
jgi:hypothetical protein